MQRFFTCVRTLIFTALIAIVPVRMYAQSAQPSPAAVPAATEDSALDLAQDMMALDGPELPRRGWNASAAFSGVYDTQLGPSGFTDPMISYRFNNIFSADVSIPIYFYVNGYTYNNGKLVSGQLSSHSGVLGDTTIAGHAQFSPGWLDSTTTAAINAPTGDAANGLSTGRVTYAVLNDFEATFRSFIPDIQLGIGDSSDLVNRRVQRNYDTLGTLAYFQAGGVYTLPRSVEIQADAYEQLPLGSQKIYTVVIRKKKRVPLLKSNGNAEDNGVTASVNWLATDHVAVSSYFNRSFRLADSTVGFTATLKWKSTEDRVALGTGK